MKVRTDTDMDDSKLIVLNRQVKRFYISSRINRTLPMPEKFYPDPTFKKKPDPAFKKLTKSMS